MTPLGIKPATFWILAQFLHQLRHRRYKGLISFPPHFFNIFLLISVQYSFNFVPCPTDRDGVAGSANCYWLDGLRIESRWERDFPCRRDRALGPPSFLYKGYRVFPGVKWPEFTVYQSPPSSARLRMVWSYYFPFPLRLQRFVLSLPLPSHYLGFVPVN
jgi:hypothetical protein